MAKKQSKARERRSTEDLSRASIAVQYELVTLAQTHDLLQELGADWESSPKDRAMSNAFLHAFLLSARSLLGFLYARNPWPSDIIAEDFFDEPEEWRCNRTARDPELANGELANMINKRLAHLTWDRANASKPLWGPFKIACDIGSVLQSFLQLVDEGKVHAQLREDVAVIMMRLEGQAECWGGLSGNMAPFSELIEFDDAEYFDPKTGSDGDT